MHDQKLERGEGGELHQTASGETPLLTTAQGGPVADDQNSLDDLLQDSTARDFVADALAHCKFIGYVDAALPLLRKAGISGDDMDEGCVAFDSAKDAKTFVDNLGKLRVLEVAALGWPRNEFRVFFCQRPEG